MFNFVASTVSTVTTTTTEKSLLSTPAVSYFPTGSYQGVAITGTLNFTSGTAATTAVLTVRNGSGTAGTIIGAPNTITTAVTTLYNVGYSVVDLTNPPASQYNVTVTSGTSLATVTSNSVSIGFDPINQ